MRLSDRSDAACKPSPTLACFTQRAVYTGWRVVLSSGCGQFDMHAPQASTSVWAGTCASSMACRAVLFLEQIALSLTLRGAVWPLLIMTIMMMLDAESRATPAQRVSHHRNAHHQIPTLRAKRERNQPSHPHIHMQMNRLLTQQRRPLPTRMPPIPMQPPPPPPPRSPISLLHARTPARHTHTSTSCITHTYT
jgi:hypothetical protein